MVQVDIAKWSKLTGQMGRVGNNEWFELEATQQENI